MTTSGITTGTMTAEEVVQAAMEELGVLSAGERAEAETLAVGLRALNWMLKSFSARGVNKWRETSLTITLPANAASVALPVWVEDVLSARAVVSSTFQRIMFRYERGQYNQLPNKLSPGQPVNFYVDRGRDVATLYFWPVPNTATQIILDVVRVIDDVTDGTQTLDVPTKWLEAVYLGLAARMAGTMGVTRVDPTTAQNIAMRAQAFEQILLDEDRPASIYMGSYDERFF